MQGSLAAWCRFAVFTSVFVAVVVAFTMASGIERSTFWYAILRLRQLGIWRWIAVLFALLNLKSLPFAWHVSIQLSDLHQTVHLTTSTQLRLLRGLVTHTRRRVRFDSRTGPKALFQPIITSSYSPALECDYNLHKSNATYFADLDISRTHLLTALCGNGIDHIRKGTEPGSNGRFGIMLGGVSCIFRREIKPYQRFEIWSRILCWDRKWVYIVSHFVRKGQVKPTLYSLQPEKSKIHSQADDRGGKQDTDAHPRNKTENFVHPGIFASAISKYVFKKGRLTIPPERILEASSLLPSKPPGYHTPSLVPSPVPAEGSPLDGTLAQVAQDLAPSSTEAAMDASLLASGDKDHWDWTRVEDERLRGLKVAELFSGLDLLHDEFSGENGPALGDY